MLVIVILVNLPVLLMIMNSFKTNTEIMTSSNFFPQRIQFDNYVHVSDRTKFWTQFKNSWIVAFYGTFFSIIVAAFAGYAISRFRGKILSLFSNSLLMLQMFPLILVLIPLFVLFRKLHLIDSYYPVIILYLTVHLPFAVWMYKGFFDSIPKDLEEAGPG